MRPAIHAGCALFALLLRWFSPAEALLMAGLACVFNLIFLPALLPSLFRPGERNVTGGIFLYPAAVLLLIASLPLPLAAAAWTIMAVGDAAAAAAGRALGGPRLPWNQTKTLAGSAAFFLAGGAGGAAMLAWMQAPDWRAALAAAAAGAVAESLPWRVNDNLAAPAAAAPVLLWLSGSSFEFHVALDPVGAALSAALGLASLTAGLVTLSGAIGGAVVATLLYSLGGWQAFVLLGAFFVLGSGATRVAYQRKAAMGLAEQRRGARTAEQAVANAGAAVIFAFLGWPLALAASLAAAAADTIATEVGPLFRGRVFLLVSGKAVAPGTSGGVSLAGTVAGIVAAAALAATAAATGLVQTEQILSLTVAAATGSAGDSLLGGTLERRGLLNNEGVNFLGTAAAGIVAMGLV
jgi:uncharacterized protein (TIGR00297 family)